MLDTSTSLLQQKKPGQLLRYVSNSTVLFRPLFLHCCYVFVCNVVSVIAPPSSLQSVFLSFVVCFSTKACCPVTCARMNISSLLFALHRRNKNYTTQITAGAPPYTCLRIIVSVVSANADTYIKYTRERIEERLIRIEVRLAVGAAPCRFQEHPSCLRPFFTIRWFHILRRTELGSVVERARLALLRASKQLKSAPNTAKGKWSSFPIHLAK